MNEGGLPLKYIELFGIHFSYDMGLLLGFGLVIVNMVFYALFGRGK